MSSLNQKTIKKEINLIKKEIIELLLDLKKEFELSMIFISHNLKLIHKICDEVVFLKNGKLVEKGNTIDVFKSPKSNYTKNLIELNFKPIVKKSKNEPTFFEAIFLQIIKYIIANKINSVKGSTPCRLVFIDSEIHGINPVLFNPVASVNNPPSQINVSHAL